jgi:hypothetical protein
MTPQPDMQVIFASAAGTHEKIANIPCEKMAKLSLKANTIIERTLVGRMPTMILHESEIYRSSAEKLVAWMSEYDLAAPATSQELRLSRLGSDDFNELVKLYAATYYFRMTRELRGDEIREEIWVYMKAGCLSANEFIMMYELLHFDLAIIKTIKNDFLWARTKGGKFSFPKNQDEQIEEYLKRIPGEWEEMMDIAIVQKKHWAGALKAQEKQKAWVSAQHKVHDRADEGKVAQEKHDAEN